MNPVPSLPALLLRGLFVILTLSAATTASAGELAGTVDWDRRVPLGTLVSGVVERVPAVPGMRVRKGDLLLALDEREAKANLGAATAEARHARILLEEAKREFDRAQELYDRTVLSEHERTVAVIGLRKAQAEAAQAEAARTRAAIALERTRILAPFDGVVVAVHAVAGQSVAAQLKVPVLLVLADDRRLRIRASASAATIDALQGAGEVQVEVAGRTLPAMQVVAGMESRQNPQGLSLYPVSVLVERPPDLVLRVGQSARIHW